MVPSLRPRPLVWLLLLLAGACGGGGGSTSPTPPPDDDCVIGDGPEVTVQGLVAYERLVLSPAGLGPGIETRPARFVDVRVRLEGGGTCYGQTSTDAAGAYSLVVRPPEGSRLEVWVYSRTNLDVLRRIAVHDALPPSGEVHAETDNFRYASAAFASTTAGPVDVVVPYGAGTYDRPSIGFGLLDTLVTCTESVRTTTGRFLPVCHAYTQLGNNGATGTSYYVVEARALTFLGGAAGQLDTTDTDYFDDAVVAHEFGHFLEFNLAHTLTRAGPHAGQELEPNFSWSEGQATGFGCLCRGTPSYIDTWGTNGNGTLIQASAENWPQTVRGIGGEETVAELVWDLGDGLDGIPDTDGDVARVGRGSLFDAFFTFSTGRRTRRTSGSSSIASSMPATFPPWTWIPSCRRRRTSRSATR